MPPDPNSYAKEKAAGKRRITLVLTKSDWDSMERIAEHWGTTKVDTLRTMIRYFEVNLGLRKKQ